MMTPTDFATTRAKFIADCVQRELEGAEQFGSVTYRENGMSEYTRHGRAASTEAEDTAAEIFDRVLARYMTAAANYDPSGRYCDACEHAGNEYNPGDERDAMDAFERIGEAHYYMLYTPKEAA